MAYDREEVSRRIDDSGVTVVGPAKFLIKDIIPNLEQFGLCSSINVNGEPYYVSCSFDDSKLKDSDIVIHKGSKRISAKIMLFSELSGVIMVYAKVNGGYKPQRLLEDQVVEWKLKDRSYLRTLTQL